MKLPFTGGCVCGAIRYECNAEPTRMFKCHCRDCQHVSGGPFTAVVYVPKSGFKITRGTVRHYSTPSLRGGHNLRGFCAECGSRLTGGESDRGVGVNAGSLDDPSWFRSQMDIHVCDALPWDALDERTPNFELYPT